MIDAPGVRLEVDGGIATVTLDRPNRKNVIEWTTWDSLRAMFESLASDEAVRVVVVTGAGDDFCAGADFKDPAYAAISADPSTGAAAMRVVNAASAALYRLPKPTIAVVDGVACGAGWGLALSCDLAMASEWLASP